MALVGDGAFGSNPSVVATAVEMGIAPVWVVMNNSAFGTIAGEHNVPSDFPAPEISGYAALTLPNTPAARERDEVCDALLDLARVWTTQSNGRADAVAVDGTALDAVAALGPREARGVEIDLTAYYDMRSAGAYRVAYHGDLSEVVVGDDPPDHAGVLEQRVDRDVGRAEQRAGRRRALGRGLGGAAPALDGDDRLGRGDPPGDRP